MTHIASCGHECDEPINATTKHWEVEGRALLYGSYCETCYAELLASGYVLLTEEDEWEWMDLDIVEAMAEKDSKNQDEHEECQRQLAIMKGIAKRYPNALKDLTSEGHRD